MAGLDQADAQIVGEASSKLGQSVDIVGDLDCDGFADLVVGADRYDALRGAAYIVFGPVSGQVLVTNPGAVDMMRVTGLDFDDQLGNHDAGAGDLDRDGHDDVLIGAYRSDVVGLNTGRVYVVFGSTP